MIPGFQGAALKNVKVDERELIDRGDHPLDDAAGAPAA